MLGDATMKALSEGQAQTIHPHKCLYLKLSQMFLAEIATQFFITRKLRMLTLSARSGTLKMVIPLKK